MGKPTKHLYEGMFIINATLSEDARQKTVEKLKARIVEGGGELLKHFEQGRKKLAYEINGRREGYYYLLYFNLPPSSLVEMRNDWFLNEDLIRFQIIRTNNVPEKIEFKPLVQV